MGFVASIYLGEHGQVNPLIHISGLLPDHRLPYFRIERALKPDTRKVVVGGCERILEDWGQALLGTSTWIRLMLAGWLAGWVDGWVEFDPAWCNWLAGWRAGLNSTQPGVVGSLGGWLVRIRPSLMVVARWV